MLHLKNYFIFLLILSFGAVNAQKTAYMSSGEILKSIPAHGQNLKIIDSLKVVYEKEIETRQTTLSEKLKSLMTKNNIATDNQIDIEVIQSQLEGPDLERFQLYVEENKMIEKSLENYNLMLQNKNTQLISPIIKMVKGIIAEYARNNDIEVVYDIDLIGQGVLFIDDKLFITEDIMQKLK